MFTPTHIYQGEPVRREGNQFIRKNGNRIPLRGFDRDELVSAEKAIELPSSVLTLVLQAASPNPGNGMMSGYATDPKGNCATLVADGVVRLSLMRRDGSGAHYLIKIPEQFTVEVTALEE